MKIIFTKNCFIKALGHRLAVKGEILDASKAICEELVSLGKATFIESPPEESEQPKKKKKAEIVEDVIPSDTPQA